MPVPCCAAEPLLETKTIKLLSAVTPVRRCPCLCVGRRPRRALLVNGLIYLRLQIAEGEVSVGRGRGSPKGHIPAMPCLP
eukprot:2760233-Pyramimonas_sp.AAC.1